MSPQAVEHPRSRAAIPFIVRWLPLAIGLAVLAYHVAPIWRDVASWAGWWDCRYFWFVLEVDHATVVDHGQLPLWNPYYCGGAPHLANPQAAPLSPLSPLIIIFGTRIGFRLGYTAGLLTALLSMRAYARTLGLSGVASAVAGTGFGICGALAMHMGGGHWSWMGFAVYPLMLRSLHLAVVERRRDHLVWGAVPLMIIVFHVPVYPLAFSFLTLGFYGLFLGIQLGLRNGVRDIRRMAQGVGSALAILALGLALGALRLVPMAEFIAAHPRSVKDWDFTWPHELFITYAMRHRERAFGSHQYVFPEFGNYFGWIGIALMFAGLVYVLRRRRELWPLIACAFVFVLFQLGNLIPMPWWLLKHLPVYANLRVAARFTIVVGIFFAALIGVAVDAWGTPALTRWTSLTRWRRALGIGVLVLAAAYLVDAASFNRIQFLPTFGSPEPREPRAAEFRQVPGDRGNMMAYPRANEGTLSCFEESPLDISPRLRGDLPADEYLAEPDAGTLRRKLWSPNRIVLEFDVKRPVTVLVNQNMDVGWRAEGGELVAGGDGGLLAARVGPGRGTLTFSYLPRSLLVGAAISLLAACAAIAFLIFDRRRHRRAPAG